MEWLLLLLLVTVVAVGLIKALTTSRQGFQPLPLRDDNEDEIWIGDVVDPDSTPRQALIVPTDLLRVHGLISGQTQMGKSRGVAGLILQKLSCGEQIVVLDPHGAIVTFVLQTLVAEGAFEHEPTLKESILYFDLPDATEKRKIYPAFDILSQGLPPHIMADDVLDAMHRVWSELDAAAAFDRTVLYGCYVLIQNNLPITLLDEVLENDTLRGHLLKNVKDTKVVSFFRNHFDKLGYRKAQEVASTNRRTMRLSFSPELRYSLENRLEDDNPYNLANIRQMLTTGKSALISLRFTSQLTSQIMGALLLTVIEQAALERLGVPKEKRKPLTIVVDEFPTFIRKENSEVGLNTFLQRTLGADVAVWLCHQNLSNVPESTIGALDNATLRLAFQLGEKDAKYAAPYFFRIDPYKVKHRQYGQGMPRPMFTSVDEQRAEQQQALMSLQFREAFVKLPDREACQIQTPHMPNPRVDEQKLTEIKEYYFARLYRPQAEIEREVEERRRQAEHAHLLSPDSDSTVQAPEPTTKTRPQLLIQPPEQRRTSSAINTDASLSSVPSEFPAPPNLDEDDETLFKVPAPRR